MKGTRERERDEKYELLRNKWFFLITWENLVVTNLRYDLTDINKCVQ